MLRNSSSVHVVAGQQNIIPSNHLDADTIVPYFTSSFLDELEDEINCSSPAAYKTFCAESGGWLTYEFLMSKIKNSVQRDNRQTDATILRDNRHTDTTGHAALQAFRHVIEQSRQPAGVKGHVSAEEPVRFLSKRVLTLFDLFCKDVLVENSCDAASIKENIIEAADSAEEYINWGRRQMQFPEYMDYDELILEDLRDSLTAKYIDRDTFSNVQSAIESQHRQCATKSLNDDLVGINRDLVTIKERLIGGMLELEIIPIIGMGGIGNTTLAKSVYEDPGIMFHFHVRAWVIVSQECCERDVFLGLLESIDPLSEEVYKEENEQLAERLYRRLKGGRYFIVVDDIWTTGAWDEMKLCFPDDGNDSRIILTSRVSKVASYVNPDSPSHFMELLCLEDSWEVLRKQVFGKEACPLQLENVGKQIAEKCQGLPLAVKVVAGYLSKIRMNLDSWKSVAERAGSATEITQLESLFKILSISYNDLPQHLKACFMSLVIFPKNYEIPVGKLIRLWIAMGFLSSELSNNLEEAAMACFNDLIRRSLIVVKKRKFDGEVKSCSIHDLLWDLRMRKLVKKVATFLVTPV